VLAITKIISSCAGHHKKVLLLDTEFRLERQIEPRRKKHTLTPGKIDQGTRQQIAGRTSQDCAFGPLIREMEIRFLNFQRQNSDFQNQTCWRLSKFDSLAKKANQFRG